MKKKGILYNLRLLWSLLNFLILPIGILNKNPDCIVKKGVSIEHNKISIKLCKIGRYKQDKDNKFFNSIGELLKTGLLELEECSDKNFHQLTFRKGNIQKYLKSVRIGNRVENIKKQLCLLVQDINNRKE